jgi:hypothetical protein
MSKDIFRLYWGYKMETKKRWVGKFFLFCLLCATVLNIVAVWINEIHIAWLLWVLYGFITLIVSYHYYKYHK